MAPPRPGQRTLPIGPVARAPSARPRNRGAVRRGHDAERELQRAFERDGRYVVRSAASAGPYDLLIPTDGGGRAVQCKCCAGEPTPATLARWYAGLPDLPGGWSKELWLKVNRRGWRRYEPGGG